MLAALLLIKIPRPVTVALLAVMAYGCVREIRPWANNLALYQRAMEVAPESQDVRSNLGREYAKRNRIAEGIAILEPLLKEAQASPRWHQQALLTLAYCYERTGRIPEALTLLRQANQIHPEASIETEILKFSAPR